MQEVNGGADVNTSQNSMSLSFKRQIGEELIVEKINKIFVLKQIFQLIFVPFFAQTNFNLFCILIMSHQCVSVSRYLCIIEARMKNVWKLGLAEIEKELFCDRIPTYVLSM